MDILYKKYVLGWKLVISVLAILSASILLIKSVSSLTNQNNSTSFDSDSLRNTKIRTDLITNIEPHNIVIDSKTVWTVKGSEYNTIRDTLAVFILGESPCAVCSYEISEYSKIIEKRLKIKTLSVVYGKNTKQALHLAKTSLIPQPVLHVSRHRVMPVRKWGTYNASQLIAFLDINNNEIFYRKSIPSRNTTQSMKEDALSKVFNIEDSVTSS